MRSKNNEDISGNGNDANVCKTQCTARTILVLELRSESAGLLDKDLRIGYADAPTVPFSLLTHQRESTHQ